MRKRVWLNTRLNSYTLKKGLIFKPSPDSSIGDLVTNWLTKYYTLLKNTIIQHSERLVTLETCDESDEETWPDQQKDNDKDKDNDNDKENDKENDKDNANDKKLRWQPIAHGKSKAEIRSKGLVFDAFLQMSKSNFCFFSTSRF